MKSFRLILVGLLFAAAVPAATPELGKEKLRRLVKMPAVAFAAEWVFDPAQGFTLGSEGAERTRQIASLRKEMRQQPPDGDRCLQLGTLYTEAKDPANAYRYLAQAVQLLRKQTDAQPGDALLLAKLGEALQGTGKAQEAESVLRRAVRAGPKEWRCWLALGRFLDLEARLAATTGNTAPAGRGARGVAAANPRGPSPEGVALVRKRLEEAGACFDQAFNLAPAEADVLLRRGLHRTLKSFVLNEIKDASGEVKTDTEVLSDYFSTESLADLQAASRLRPKDYQLIGNAVLFEVYGGNARNGQRRLGDAFELGVLPDATQRSIRTAMTRLEDLGQEPEAAAAAGAWEVLGILQGPLLHETNRCVASLRHALALDPSREQAWELLTLSLARAERYDELLAVCEEHLKEKDSARSQLLLAKAHEKLKQYDNAEEAVLAALKLTPDDFAMNLSLAALLVRRSRDAGMLAEAGRALGRCDQLLANLPQPQRTRQLVIDFTLIRSIYLALADDVVSARKWAKSVLDADAENETAREILAAMAY